MPVYLLHGFRWPRQLIRIHIILQNLDDAAAEWLVAPATTAALLGNFKDLHPECMQHLPNLRFVEQYDPNDTSPGAGSQPYAYVADMVEEVRLGVDVDDVRGKGVASDQWAAMMELRDKLAPEEKVAWYVVVCGDEERWAPPTVELLQQGTSSSVSQHRPSQGSSTNANGVNGSVQTPPEEEPSPPRGLKKLFSRKKSSRHTNGVSPPSRHTNGVSPPKSSGSGTKAPNDHSWEPGPDQEVITGPVQYDDPLSAPPPTIRQGKDTDFPIRTNRQSAVPAFATSPQAKSPPQSRAMSPHIRNGNAFAAQQYRTNSTHENSTAGPSNPRPDRSVSPATHSMASAVSKQSQSSSRTVSPLETFHRPVSPQSSYHATAPPSSYHATSSQLSYYTTAKPSLPLNWDSKRRPSTQGMPSVAGAAQNGEASNGGRAKPTQFTVNSMAQDVKAAYGYTDRDLRHRQSVTQDELVAKGLDEGVFAGLR